MRTRTRTILAGLVLAAALVGGVAWATIPDDNGLYTACKLNATGTIRLIDPSGPSTSLLSRCTSYETKITWNQRGPKGEPGAAGTNGTNGIDGKDGQPGTNGSNGIDGAAGAPGDPCLPSDPACVGPKGDTGAPGTNGTNGTNGINGTDGAKGDPCLASDPACVGPKGDTGAAGTNGTNGTDGTNGAAGSNGTDGAPGAKGEPGAQGDPGAPGAAGSGVTSGEIKIEAQPYSDTPLPPVIETTLASDPDIGQFTAGCFAESVPIPGGGKIILVYRNTTTHSQDFWADAQTSLFSLAPTGNVFSNTVGSTFLGLGHTVVAPGEGVMMRPSVSLYVRETWDIGFAGPGSKSSRIMISASVVAVVLPGPGHLLTPNPPCRVHWVLVGQ